MEVNRTFFLLLIIFFIFFSPGETPAHFTTPTEQSQYKLYLQLQRNETEILKNSTYDSVAGNLTGVSHSENETSFIPDPVKKFAKTIWFSELSGVVVDHHDVNSSNKIDDPNDRIEKSSPFEANNDPQPPSILSKLVFFSNYSGIFSGTWDKPEESLLSELVPRHMEIPKILKTSSHNDENDNNDTNSLSSNENIDHNETNVEESNSDTDDIYYSGRPQLPSKDRVFLYGVDGNITESEGKLSISVDELALKESHSPNITLITMDIIIQDTDESSQYTLSMKGLHIKSTGNVVLTTSSLKYSGLQYLPHLVLQEDYFDEAKALMLRYLNNTLTIYEDERDYTVFEDQGIASKSCEFVFYGHFHSVNLTPRQLRDIEDEIETPVGRPHKPVPPMQLVGFLYSPDCALAVKSNDIEGEKYELYWKRIRAIVVIGVILLISQTVLIAKQMRDTNTPSYMCKVSFYSIAMMSVIDGSVWVASFASSFVDGLTLPFMAIAFLSFALTSMFEMRYLVKIYQSQLTEHQADARVRDATLDSNGVPTFIVRPDGSFATPTSASPTPRSPEPTLPITENETTDENNLEDLSERAIGSKIYSWFYFALLGFMITTIVATTWPVSYRRIYEFIAILGFYSMWVPQIHRNVSRGFRRSFLWQFIIGTSIVRLIPVLYFTLDKNNILKHHYDPTLALSAVVWLAIQIIILYSQTVFGPRFFLPKGYLPVLYDYHPILTQGDIETGITNIPNSAAPIPSKPTPDTSRRSSATSSKAPLLGSSGSHNSSFSAAAESAANKDNVAQPKVDCAICMMPVELVITPKESSAAFVTSPALMLARRRYMVTPCRHVFHTECMEQWMRTRLQCPICRNPLPPV